jgi:hypothetical protein
MNHKVIIDPEDKVLDDHRGKRTFIVLDATPCIGTLLTVRTLEGVNIMGQVKGVMLEPNEGQGSREHRHVPTLLVGSVEGTRWWA